jgi:hypothetical protein
MLQYPQMTDFPEIDLKINKYLYYIVVSMYQNIYKLNSAIVNTRNTRFAGFLGALRA